MAGARCESGRDNHQCNQTIHDGIRKSWRRDVAPFSLCGTPEPNGAANLWAQNAEGHLAMKAEAIMQSA
jgi:hypothetical protein